MSIVDEFASQLGQRVPSLGASWVKADFHFHTIASYDHNYQNTTYDELAEAVKQAGYRLVVVTDHNTLNGYQEFRKAAQKRGILALPGVEFNVRALAVGAARGKLGSRLMHLLAVFDPDLPNLDFALKTLLSGGNAAASILSRAPEEIAIEDRTVHQVCGQLKQLGALVMAAHLHSQPKSPEKSRSIDDIFDDGLFLKFVEDDLFDALEVLNLKTAAFFDGKHAETNNLNVACVRSSDAHGYADIGRRATWLKMEELSFRNLKRALTDHQARVSLVDPQMPDYHLVLGAHIKGKFLPDTWLRFNPGLNCLIGPKGVGKSTALECIRWALELSVPEIPGVAKAKQRFQSRIHDLISEVLGPEATVKVLIQSATGHKFLVVRDRYRKADRPPVAYAEDDSEVSVPFHTDVYGADYYGWEEVGNAAENANIQLDIVDRHCAPLEIGGTTLSMLQVEEQLKAVKRRMDGLVDGLAQVRQEVVDVKAKQTELQGLQVWLKTNESTEKHLKDLENLTKVATRLKASSGFLTALATAPTVAGLRAGSGIATPDDVAAQAAAVEARIAELAQAQMPAELAVQAGAALQAAVTSYRNAVSAAHASLGKGLSEAFTAAYSSVQQLISGVEAKKHALMTTAETVEGSGVAEKLARLHHQQEKHDELRDELAVKPLESLKKREADLAVRYSAACREIEGLRTQMSAARSQTARDMTEQYRDIRVQLAPRSRWDDYVDVLEGVFKGSYLGAGIKSMPDAKAFPEKLAEAIFVGDVQGLQSMGLAENQARLVIEWVGKNLDRLKQIHNAEVADEPIVELLIDRENPGVDASYRRSDRLSSGQRSTALFPLITHGSKNPLLIDQPEDDLDNSYVFSYLVEQVLRPSKGKRQFIFVTHNANIPVLGDAENILVMAGERQEGRCERHGYIDNPDIIHDVTRVLEGSKEAFERRTQKYGL